MVAFKYTPEMTEWVRNNCAGREWEDVAVSFNQKFGLYKTARQLRAHAHDNDIHNGIYHGKSFHKAHWRPVGSTRLDKDGYVIIKVAEPCKWRRAHLVEWEKYHIPLYTKNDMLLFLDGNRQNWHIDNLYPVPRRLIGPINSLGYKITKDNVKTLIAMAELMCASNDAEAKVYAGGDRRKLQFIRWRKLHEQKMANDPEYREKVLAYGREYSRRPDVRERVKANAKTPEGREKCREYQRRYLAKKRLTLQK